MAIDKLEKRYHDDDQVVILYIYCSYQERGSHTAANLIKSLLWQLAVSSDKAFGILDNMHTAFTKTGCNSGPTRDQYVQVLLDELHACGLAKILIFVDALDELDGAERSLLLDTLRRICNEISAAHVLAMSRHMTVPDLAKSSTRLTVQADAADIQAYVRRQISFMEEFAALKDDAAAVDQIAEGISKRAERMFVFLFLSSRSPRRRR